MQVAKQSQIPTQDITYKAVTFRKNGNSRFIVEATVKEGWNRLQEVPKLLDVSSINVLDPNSAIKVIGKAFRDYDDSVQPALPIQVEVITERLTYTGLLVKKDQSSISIVTSGENATLVEITAPYVLRYINCTQDNCQSIVPRINLQIQGLRNYSMLASDRVRLTFAAGGFSWDAAYKAFIDFDNYELTKFTGEILCRNETNLPLVNIGASFLAKSDDNDYPRPMMAQRSAQFSSQQTETGGALYYLQQAVTIPEKSIASFNLFELNELTALIETRFDILQRPRHPVTIVTFEVPDTLVDGIPAGTVECWNGMIWLTNAYLPMTGPGEYITLHLGENAFIRVKVSMTINQIEEKQADQSTVNRSMYDVTVSIQNNSQRNAVIDPYHPIDREFRDLKVTNNIKTELSEGTDELGRRLKFRLPTIEPRHLFTFHYSLVA